MCIYCNTTNYRKIYENHYGPIPKDENGRKYEIHHLDGNRKNNELENLKCVTIQDHYDIHYAQGDWGACALIAKRMNLTPEMISELSTKHNMKMIRDGTHPFLGDRNPMYRMLANGTHPFFGGEVQRRSNINRVINGTNPFCSTENNKIWQKKRVDDKTHNFLGSEGNLKRLAEGRHPSQMKKTCEHCDKTISLGMYKRWHGNNCKLLR
jgi:hypothetical protein